MNVARPSAATPKPIASGVRLARPPVAPSAVRGATMASASHTTANAWADSGAANEPVSSQLPPGSGVNRA
jgi:hypothetical protein